MAALVFIQPPPPPPLVPLTVKKSSSRASEKSDDRRAGKLPGLTVTRPSLWAARTPNLRSRNSLKRLQLNVWDVGGKQEGRYGGADARMSACSVLFKTARWWLQPFGFHPYLLMMMGSYGRGGLTMETLMAYSMYSCPLGFSAFPKKENVHATAPPTSRFSCPRILALTTTSIEARRPVECVRGVASN